MRFEVTAQDDSSSLTRERWVFWLRTGAGHIDVVVDEYHVESRASKRHKWRTDDFYARCGGAYSPARILERDVPLPWGVGEDARQKAIELIRVGKWGDLQ